MYKLMYLISFCVRQFLLPNPFVPLGDIAAGITLFTSVALGSLSFRMVGLMIYKL